MRAVRMAATSSPCTVWHRGSAFMMLFGISEGASMIESAKEAARRLAAPAIAQGFMPEALHTYRRSDGTDWYYRIRAKKPDGDKWIRPMHRNGRGYELGEPAYPDGRKPLYNLDRIVSDVSAPIWICEGEKACDALTALGAIATTSGGAQSAACADWTVLRGRECRLWPDNDDAGKNYMGEVAAMLEALGCNLSAVALDALNLPPKGDAADWAETHQNATYAGLDALPRRAHQATIMDATAPDLELRVLNLAELLTLEMPEREVILAPWLLAQSLTMIHAWRGVGKTFVALNIAYAVATGGSFLKWKADRPRKVLYLDGEMPATALRERLAAIVKSDDREFEPSYLRFLTPDVQDGHMPDLSQAADQAAVEAIMGDAELIVVDNISTLVRNVERENDAESWKDVGAWALRMRRQGKAVLFIHHSGKGGAQRGSSKKEDTLDVVIALKQPSDYLPEQGARFEIHFEKYRNDAGDDTKSIEAHLAPDQTGTPVWTYRSVEDTTFDRVVALAREGLKARDIADELGKDKSVVSRHLSKARSLGMLERAAA